MYIGGRLFFDNRIGNREGNDSMDSRFLSLARSLVAQIVACAIAAIIVIASASGIAFSTKRATLQVDGASKKVVTGTRTVSGLLKENGIEVAENDRIIPALDAPVTTGMTVAVKHAVPVTIAIVGGKLRVKTTAPTVKVALQDVGLRIGPTDKIEPPPNTSLEKGMFIKVTPEFRVEEKSKVTVPFKVVKKKTTLLTKGKEVVSRKGQNGEAIKSDERVYSGTYLARRSQTQQIVKAPVDKVVKVGVGQRGSNRGRRVMPASYSPSGKPSGKSVVVSATAYVPGYDGVGYITATGRRAGYGIIAVDPRVIPLGTKLYVPGYGNGIAADTGGAIKGNRIDVCYNSVSQAFSWGRRSVRITILD